MATTVVDLTARLRADTSQYERAMGNAGRATAGLERGFGNAVSGITQKLKGLTTAAATTAAAATSALVVPSLFKGWERVTTIEDATVALGVALGDTEKAAWLLDEVLEVVKGTPFDFDQFASAAQQMVGMGVEAEKVPLYLEAIGEASATQGKNANEMAGRLSRIFGQVKAQGRLTGDALMSLGETGVNALSILGNHFGVTTDEMRKMVSDGAVPADEALQVLSEGILNGSDGVNGATVAFAGTMEGLRKTLSGAVGGVGSAMSRLGAAFIQPFSPSIVEGANSFTAVLDKLAPKVTEFANMIVQNPAWQSFLDWVKTVPDMMGPLLDKLQDAGPLLLPIVGAIGALASSNIAGALGPLSVLVPHLGVISGLFLGLVASSEPLRAALQGLWERLQPVLTALIDALKPALEALVPVAENVIMILGDALGSIIEALAPTLIILANAAAGLAPIITRLAEVLAPLLVRFAEMAGDLLPRLLPAFFNLLDAIVPIVEIIGEELMKHFDEMAPMLPELAAAFVEISNALAEVLIEITPLIPYLIQFLSKMEVVKLKILIFVLETFANVIGWIVTYVKSVVIPVFAWWFGFVIDRAKNVGDIFSWLWDNALQPAFSAIADFVTGTLVPVFQTIWHWIEDNIIPIFQKLAGFIVDNIPKVVTVFKVLGMIVGGVFVAIYKAIEFAWTKVIWPVFQAIWSFITGTLVPIFQTLWSQVQTVWDGITREIDRAWKIIQALWNAVYWYVENYLMPIFQVLWDVVQNVWNWIQNAIKYAWENVIQPIWRAIQWFIENILAPIFERIRTVAETVWNAVGDVIGWVWDNLISPAFEKIQEGIGFVIDTFNTIRTHVENAFSAIYDVIVPPFVTAFNAIANLWNNTVGKLTFDVPWWVPGIGGNTFSMPTLPTLNGQAYRATSQAEKEGAALAGFADGGFVGGPIGGAVPAIVHGGEFVLSRKMLADLEAGRSVFGGGNRSSSVTYNFNGVPVERAITISQRREARELNGTRMR